MGDFEVDTRLEGADGRYRAELSKDWEIWGPNGGYVAAIALRAAGREARIQRPASFAGHFLSIARFESVDVHVETLRRGRRSESFHIRLLQEGRLFFSGLVRTAAEGPGLEHDAATPPDVAGPEGLKSFDEIFPDQEAPYPFWKNIDGRPVDAEFPEVPMARDPILREWFRFRPRATFDDPFVDAGRSLLLIDTLSWPAASMPHTDRSFQAPNLDVTAWFHRAAPESEFLLGDHASPVAAGGLMGTTAQVWSQDRRLLASGGAQLMCIPARPEPR